MARGHMRDLVSEDRRQLVVAARGFQQAAVDEEVAAGQGKRVGRLLVDRREGVDQVLPVADRHQPLAEQPHPLLHRLIRHDGELLLYLAGQLAAHLHLFIRGGEGDLLARRREVILRAGAGGRQQGEGHRRA